MAAQVTNQFDEVAHSEPRKIPAIKVPKVLTPFQGFVDFIRTQGVVGLAVGIVLGVQIKAVVDSFVAGFANPILGLIFPGNANLALKTYHLNIGSRTGVFAWGAFLTQVITFFIIAAVVYLFVHGLKLDQLDKKKDK